MRIKLYALFFLISTLSLKAQDGWVISDTLGLTSLNNTATSNLITFGPNIYATTGNFSVRLHTSSSGNPGSWSMSNTSGQPCCGQFTHEKVGKTLDGGGYLYLGGWYGPNTDGQVYSSSDGQNWNLYLNTHLNSIKDIKAYKGNGATDSTYIVAGSEVWKGAIDANDPYNGSNSWRVTCNFDSVMGIAPGSSFSSSAIHAGKLYYGLTKGTSTSAQMVQTSDGLSYSLDTLFRTAAGYDTFNESVSAMSSFGGYLYVAFANSTNGAQLLRTNDDITWQLVRSYPGYFQVTDFAVTGGTMYIALENNSLSSPGMIERTTDGVTYTVSSPDLFGVPGNYGGLGRFTVFNNHLYYGSEYSGGGGFKISSGSTSGFGGGHAGQIWRLCLSGPAPVITFGNNNAVDCIGANLNVNVTSTHSTYSWSNGSTSANGPVSVPGNYQLTVSDANGCFNSAGFSVTGLTPPNAPYVTQNMQACKGSTVVLTPSDPSIDVLALNTTGNAYEYANTGDLTSQLIPTDSLTETIEFWVKPFGQGVMLSEVNDQSQSSWSDSQAELVGGDSLLVRVWNGPIINLGHLNYGTWYHVAYRYTRIDSTFSAFLNGALVASIDSVGRQSAIQYGQSTMYLLGQYCSQNLGSGAAFPGQFREFRYWTVGRTNSEISSNMNTNFAPGTPGLAAYYKFNQGSGSIAVDSSGNNLNGNIYPNASLVTPPVSFTWSPSTFLSGTSGTVNCTPDSTITYTLTSNGPNGCTSTFDYEVYVAKINFASTSPRICSPDTITTLEVIAEVLDSIMWTPTTFLTDSTSSYIQVYPPSTTVYHVSGVDGICHISDSVKVLVGPGISGAVLGPTTNVCLGDQLNLVATPSGGTAPYTFTWVKAWVNDPPFTGTVFNTGNINTTFSVSVNVYIVDSIGCSYGFNYQPLNVISLTDLTGNITKQTGGLVTSGNVYLFKHQPGSAAFDSILPVASISATGDYIYTSLANGDYLIKAIADTLLYPDSWSTYYGNDYIWDSSLIYHHGCAQIDTANIEVIEVVPMIGNGAISGYVLEGPGFGQKLIGGPGHVMVPGGPIRGVDVKLGKNPGGGAAARTFTDSTGYYEFDNVDQGTYRIYVDIPNLPMDSTRQVAITAQDTSVHNDYFVDSSKVYVLDTAAVVGIYSSSIKNSENFSIYPNPAKGLANLSYELADNAQVTIEVYTTIGEKIAGIYSGRQQPGKFSCPLDVRALNMKGGVYIISLRTNNKVSTQRVVVIE
ncbi:MAG: SdrD B-like domain-containing protein [Bacteroidia bacterium]